MPQQTGHERHDEAGAATHRVRVNEIVTQIAFGGRRWVYTRVAGLSGSGPGDRVLDLGCGGGYLALPSPPAGRRRHAERALRCSAAARSPSGWPRT